MNHDTDNVNTNPNDHSGVPPKQIQLKLPFEEEEPEVTVFDEGGDEFADEIGVN